MVDTPHIVRSEAHHTAVVRLTVPRSEIQRVMGPAISEAIAAAAAQGIGPVGPVYSRHFRIDPAVFDFEVGVPVSSPVAPVGRVVASQLPSTTVARTVYRGPYEGLGHAWGQFEQWIATSGHACASELWERYLKGPESSQDPLAWQTELSKPLTSAR